MKDSSAATDGRRPVHMVPSMVRRGELRAEEHIASIFERIDRFDPRLHAYLQLDRDGALARAREIDRRARRGERLGKLAGLGIAVKDNICVKSLQATCASRILAGFNPPYSATAVSRRCGHIRCSRKAPAIVRTPVMMNDAFIVECRGEHT